MRLGLILTIVSFALPLYSATFGTVAVPPGGAAYSDITLDEARSRVYLTNTAANRIDVFNNKTRSYGVSISVGTQPVSTALSRDGRYLYVTAYTDSTLDVIDLNSNTRVSRISLPSNPEGVAVAADGRILVSAIAGTNTANSLIVVDGPAPDGTFTGSYANVPVLPPASTPPTLPQPPLPVGRVFLSYRSRLAATPDGRFIVGANGNTAATKAVFVYEAASGTVLRSRAVANLSTTLAVASDASKFMAGATLFDLQTLQVIAQENAANAGFTFPGGSNFNLQQNEGGSAFSPDGSVLYAAFNIAPVGAARPNITQLLLNDPENLLINLGIEMPENLAGKMVIDAAGANIYAISDSGLMVLPVSTIANSPLAVPHASSVLLINDPCNVLKATTGSTVIDNAGKGRFTISLNAQAGASNPVASVVNTGTTPVINFRYNNASTNPGTVGPSDFVLTSSEAINNPGVIHVYQNNRDSVASGTIVPISINALTAEGLTDIVQDTQRNRLYITNSGMNRVEVYDLKQKQFVAPIKVGQLPHGMALDPTGVTLYVANAGGESVSIVDLVKGVQTGRVAFPALPFNATVAIVNPVAIAASGRGPQMVMSNGSIWKIDGNVAIPRALNTAIFGNAAVTVPGGNPAQWSLAATPAGEYVLLVSGTGNAYLYDDSVDDFTLTRQVIQTPTAYVGSITAGPQGRYYAVGGTILNSSLSAVQGGANGLSASNRPVAAVAAVSATQIAEFTQPLRVNPTAPVADTGLVELYDPSTGQSQGSAATLEGPQIILNGLARTAIFARMMAVDTSSSTAYVLTATGLSIVALNNTVNTNNRPAVSTNGIVNPANFQSAIATGGLFTIIGKNLGSPASASTPLPTTLGGVCVTLNSVPIPLLMTSGTQINGQIPVTLAAGRYPLVIRSLDNQLTSTTSTITVAKYAPAIFVNSDGQAAIMHPDGTFVTPKHAAKRDETLTIYATGMGPTHGGTVTTGNAAPSSPVADTDPVLLYFGNPLWKQGGIIVRSSSLLPGMVGVTQIKATVPGFHIQGAALPVLVKIGGISSPTTGSGLPTVAVN